jgi:hypothetical protein
VCVYVWGGGMPFQLGLKISHNNVLSLSGNQTDSHIQFVASSLCSAIKLCVCSV